MSAEVIPLPKRRKQRKPKLTGAAHLLASLENLIDVLSDLLGALKDDPTLLLSSVEGPAMTVRPFKWPPVQGPIWPEPEPPKPKPEPTS